ncbi:MAG: sulfatase-like hydrolase/transferase, partial [Lentisphaeraceae bacterium]|nr:sulfatase-like hydrolase/transferase [Lentisphaeraceae bacterium]
MKKAVLVILLYLITLPVFAAPRPNIIVILTDDMGYSDLGCFGGEIATPNLDRLAKSGLRFTDFYNTARCWPTRATLLTGRYCDKIKGKVTLAQLMKKAAYQTAMAGKWHLGHDPKKDGPLQKGFDDFYGTMAGAGSFYDPLSLVRNEQFIETDTEDYYYTDRIGSEAVRQIKNFSKSEKPFFHYVAFTAAHWPLHAPEKTVQKYIERYKSGWDKMSQDRYKRMLKMGIINKEFWPMPAKESRAGDWDKVKNKAYHARNMAIYAAMVDHMDQAVGKIISALKKTKQFDNTLIIYCHDNGACPELLSGNGWSTATNIMKKAKKAGKKIQVGNNPNIPNGGPMTYGSVGPGWAWAQNTPFRRYKANVYNGGSNTPAIVHWPAGLKTEPGAITSERG